MSDNVTLPGTGTVVETIDIGGGVERQVVTIAPRAGGATDSIGSLTETAPATDTASSGLNGRLQRLAQRITTLISSTLATSVADGSNVTLGAKADAKSTATDTTSVSAMSVWKQISASIQAAAASLAGSLTVATHAVTQSGTWTVQPGNTANTTAWKVDGSAVTQPASIADNSHVTIGAKADAKSTATDTTSVSAMSVWKQISASVQSLVTGTVLAADNKYPYLRHD